MTKEHKIKELIQAYEDEKMSFEEIQTEIEKVIGERIEKHLVDNYWRGEDLDNLCRRLAIEPIDNWQELTDAAALKLLEEIYQDVTRDDIISRNAEALEKRYRKTTGTISDYVFDSELKPKEILKKLKENTVTYL